MKIKNLLLTVATMLAGMAAMAQTDGFSYQAVVRDANGELVKSQKVGLLLTIADNAATNVMYKESQTPSTNEFGVLSVTVGSGKALDGTKLSNVDWTKPAWLHIAIDTKGGTNYVDLGATKIQAVPVALYAARSGNSEQAVGVTNPTTTGDALFEVKDKDGNVVFAVYPNGVHVYIDPEAGDDKLRRSGFLVTGRETTKDGEPNNYFAVNGDGTQVYVDNDDTKLRRSGFLVTGRETTKEGTANNYFAVNDEGTKVFVDDDDSKLRRSGFLVTGRETTKDDDKGAANKYLSVGDDGTKIYIDDQLEEDSKLRRSGFLVTGRETTKDGSATNYMKVATNGTLVHFDNDASKLRRSGFLVTGRTATKGSANEYFNIDAAKDAKVINSENRVYWYPEKNAFMAGNLKVSNAAQVGTNSFNAGYQNIASGNYSQAMGYMSTAKGDYSTAIGRKANAEALRAFAFGDSAQAKGIGSYAFGEGAIAYGASSFAFGSKGRDTLEWDKEPIMPAKATGDCAYAIGAGTWARGVGSTAIGVRDTARGHYSISIGYHSNANTYFATAIGHEAKSGGQYSFAIGSRATVQNGCSHSIAIGSEATCENNGGAGGYSTAIGYGAIATGMQSTAIGNANSIGAASLAFGSQAKSEGMYSTAIGNMTKAIGMGSIAMGDHTTAYSYGETVVGFDNTEYTPEEQNDDGEEPATNRLFVVGNGRYEYEYTYDEETDEEHEWDTICYSDALIIYKNGDAEFRGNIYPSAEKNVWTEATSYTLGTSSNLWNKVYASNGTIQTSDQRLKTNIKPLERALNKVLTLNGVTYEWRVKEFPNRHFDSNRHVGVLAQELEAVLPEAVETGEDGYKSVNYSEITPLLIEAVKELKAEKDAQDKKIEALEAEKEAQGKKIEALEAQLKEILEKMQ